MPWIDVADALLDERFARALGGISSGTVPFTDHLRTFNAPLGYSIDDEEAWAAGVQCSFCGGTPLMVVAQTHRYGAHPVQWLHCIRCGQGAVVNGFQMSPGLKQFPTPEGTPEAESKLWEEVRTCLSVDAYDAVAMICRKLLLHIVYTHQRSINPNAKPKKIRFEEAVNYLVNNEVIPKNHHVWVDTIRTTGNAATHELPGVSAEQAAQIALFTHQLFTNIYEMPARANFDSQYVGDAAMPTVDDDTSE
jgi:Domain of unknown function (DUF4145)